MLFRAVASSAPRLTLLIIRYHALELVLFKQRVMPTPDIEARRRHQRATSTTETNTTPEELFRETLLYWVAWLLDITPLCHCRAPSVVLPHGALHRPDDIFHDARKVDAAGLQALFYRRFRCTRLFSAEAAERATAPHRYRCFIFLADCHRDARRRPARCELSLASRLSAQADASLIRAFCLSARDFLPPIDISSFICCFSALTTALSSRFRPPKQASATKSTP